MIEEIFGQLSFKTVSVAVVGAYVLLQTAQWLNKERKRRALGGRGRKVPSWYPFGDSNVSSPSKGGTDLNRYRDHRAGRRRYGQVQGHGAMDKMVHHPQRDELHHRYCAGWQTNNLHG